MNRNYNVRTATPMKERIKAILSNAGIHTLPDIDVYARNHKVNGEIPSRYDVLCSLVGENVAVSMLHELSIRQCCGKAIQ